MSCRFSAALAFLLLSTLPALAQFRTVTVQNANDNPVPATIQNTPSVNVANTPTVSVSGTVPVSGTVGITGTPNVNASITGTPAVSVTNLPTGTAGPAATTSLLTKNLNDPALQPFQRQMTCTATAALQCQTSFTVPPGKQLVLEYVQFVSVENDPTGDPTFYYGLTTTAGGTTQGFNFGPGTRLRPNNPLGEHLVRIYADAGSTVQFVGVSLSNTSTVTYYAWLSGHLVNTQ